MDFENSLWVEKYRPKELKDLILTDNYREKFEEYLEKKEVPHLLFVGLPGSGKAQPLYSKIKIPNGWTTMGDIKLGDKICTPDGKISNVIGLFPQGKKNIYRIHFKDGRSSDCCEDHLWKVYNKGWKLKWKILPTKEIQKSLNYKTNKLYIPLLKNEEFSYKRSDLLIDPYILGVMLGDGYIKRLRLTSIDDEIIKNVNKNLNENYYLKKGQSFSYRISMKSHKGNLSRKGNILNYYKKSFIDLNLFDKLSHNKFIPEIYKKSSYIDRLELIRGLMDTDGTSDLNTRSISYSTSSKLLAKDFQYLIRSIGGLCSISTKKTHYVKNGNIIKGLLSYRCNIRYQNPEILFKLQRKKNSRKQKIILKNRIIKIEYVGKEECQCILIDHPDHLYITDDFVVTHNSTLARILCSKKGILSNPKSNLLIVNGSSKKCRSITYTDEVIEPFLRHPPLGDKLKIVFIDEADKLSQDNYDSLRGPMEKYVKQSRFIWTGNYISKIPSAIQSRFQIFKFEQISIEYVFKYCKSILENENVKYNVDDLSYIIKALYPDVRKIVNDLEQCTSKGKLVFDADIIKTKEKKVINVIIEIVNSIKAKNTNRINKLITEILDLLNESDLDFGEIYSKLFYTKSVPVPAKIVINKYTNSHKDCLVPSMHFMAMVFEVCRVLSK